MSVAAAIRQMLAAGLTIEQALVAVEAFEHKPRSSAAIRQQRYRDKKASLVTSRDVTDVTSVTSDGHPPPSPPPPSPPRDINSTPPSLPPPKPPSDDSSRARGKSLPEEFSLSEANLSFGREKGLSDGEINECLAEFRDYWAGVPGTRGRKLDWEATLRNRLREVAAKKALNRNKGPGPPNGAKPVSWRDKKAESFLRLLKDEDDASGCNSEEIRTTIDLGTEEFSRRDGSASERR